MMERRKMNVAVMDASAGRLIVLPLTLPPSDGKITTEEWIEAQLTAKNLLGPDVEWMELVHLDLDLSELPVHVASFRIDMNNRKPVNWKSQGERALFEEWKKAGGKGD